MKVPLEPIPTEQIAVVKNERPHAEVHRQSEGETGEQAGRPPGWNSSAESSKLEKAYPWLLGASVCLSAMLCWMYVTKPVIEVRREVSRDAELATADSLASGKSVGLMAVASAVGGRGAPELVPSDDSLPGASPTTAMVSSPDSRALRAAHAQGGSPYGLGWEKTNLKVQHVLSSDPGNGELEKIVLDVPVLYQTRTMRWSPPDVAKARAVLARLMIYERNLSNLKKEGQVILGEWNALLESTVPSAALRADSPSLPYNHSQGSQPAGIPLHQDGEPVIKIDQ